MPPPNALGLSDVHPAAPASSVAIEDWLSHVRPSPSLSAAKVPRRPRAHTTPLPLGSATHRKLARTLARTLPPSLDRAAIAAMLTERTVHLSLLDSDDDWLNPSPPQLHRARSAGGSWKVTSIGKGYSHHDTDRPAPDDPTLPAVTDSPDLDLLDVLPVSFLPPPALPSSPPASPSLPLPDRRNSKLISQIAPIISVSANRQVHSRPPSPVLRPSALGPGSFSAEPVSFDSPIPSKPVTPQTSSVGSSPSMAPPRTSSSPRPRRRSSQARVSLIAGRVSIIPSEPPSPQQPMPPPMFARYGSATSLLSVAATAAPPTPSSEFDTFLDGRSISEFVIEDEIGRGAYGMVKRAREMQEDGKMGPPLIIKQVIKSRILADCWKKHPKHGTIPIEIYVMSAISSTSYVLPAPRPWSPARNQTRDAGDPVIPPSTTDPPFFPASEAPWVQGRVVKGHPNICSLIDFFEDNHYYYLVLPCLIPEPSPEQPDPPSDLFELVENHPHGLDPSAVRSYLGQIADALAFLHSRGIVHRDVKDENVVLAPGGRCILIDFGSSGIVKKGGWDTFSGTLDYAGPEILRGERYNGKEQDVWAFGVVAFVLLVGECPFQTAAEAQEGLTSPFSNAAIALDERCGEDKESIGEEPDGGGGLGDAAALIRACLQVEASARPSFEQILQCKFLQGVGGWGMNVPPPQPPPPGI